MGPRWTSKRAVPCPGLAAAVAKSGLTHEALAKRLRVARSTLSTWVHRVAIPARALPRVAKVLKVHEDELLRAPPFEPDYRARVVDLLARVLEQRHEGVLDLFEGEDAAARALEHAEEALERDLVRLDYLASDA